MEFIITYYRCKIEDDNIVKCRYSTHDRWSRLTKPEWITWS